MEKEIKKLIEKYTKQLKNKQEKYVKNSFAALETKWIVDDLEQLLEDFTKLNISLI